MRIKTTKHIIPRGKAVILKLIPKDINISKGWFHLHNPKPPLDEDWYLVRVWAGCSNELRQNIDKRFCFIRYWEPFEYEMDWDVYVACKEENLLFYYSNN